MQRLKGITQKADHTKSYDFTSKTMSGKVDDSCLQTQTDGGNSCLGHRHLVAFWCFYYFGVVSSNVSVISVAMVAMVNHTQVSKMHTTNLTSLSCPLPTSTDNSTTKTVIDGPFDWDSQQQGQILGFSVFGYIASNFFAGRIAEILGAKRTLLVADLSASLCTGLSPFAASWSAQALTAIQTGRGLAQGFIVPCVFVIMANWFPRNERGLLSSFASIGSSAGSIVAGVTVGRLCDTPALGWPSAFYFMGGFNVFMSIIFACVFYEVPKFHPYISKEELKYIVGDQENDMSLKRPPAPWKEIFTSIPMYALIVGKFGLYWAIAYFIYMHPTFMGTVLHFSMTKNGLISSMLFLLMTVGTIITMVASHWLRKKDYVGVSNLRKGCNSIGALGFSLCLIGVCLAECEQSTNLVFFSLAIFFSGFGVCGSMIAGGDMSPTFSGSLAGFTSATSCVSTIILPLITGALTKRETLGEWLVVFYINIAVILICGLIFQVFGSADIQPWDSIASPEPKTPPENQPQTMQLDNINNHSKLDM